jgi:hypothetical protein
MARNSEFWLLAFNSSARHLTGERRQAYLGAWRRGVILGLIAIPVLLWPISQNRPDIAFFLGAALAVAEVFYTIARGETYLQLRRKQWQIDKQDSQRLYKDMEEVGHGKK